MWLCCVEWYHTVEWYYCVSLFDMVWLWPFKPPPSYTTLPYHSTLDTAPSLSRHWLHVCVQQNMRLSIGLLNGITYTSNLATCVLLLVSHFYNIHLTLWYHISFLFAYHHTAVYYSLTTSLFPYIPLGLPIPLWLCYVECSHKRYRSQQLYTPPKLTMSFRTTDPPYWHTTHTKQPYEPYQRLLRLLI